MWGRGGDVAMVMVLVVMVVISGHDSYFGSSNTLI